MEEFNLAISASKTYAPYAKVMLSSFYKTHPNSKVNLYLFYLDPTIKNLESDFIKISKAHNKLNGVDFVKVNKSQIESVDNEKGWAIDLWCRWYLLDYLVDKCDRVLILGIDTMLQGNISNFYFQNLKSYYFSCSPDMMINNSEPTQWPGIKTEMEKRGFKDKSKYINGDVVLVNLHETRNNLSFGDFLTLYSQNQFICWDQDVITYCFNDKIKFQDYLLYNYFPNLGINTINDYKLYKNAKIIHFAGGPKPWLVPICEANKYNAISDWWVYANSMGLTESFPYVRCYLLAPFRKLKSFTKNTFIGLIILKILNYFFPNRYSV